MRDARKRITTYLGRNPGCSPSELARALGESGKATQRALRRGRAEGWITGTTRRLFAAPAWDDPPGRTAPVAAPKPPRQPRLQRPAAKRKRTQPLRPAPAPVPAPAELLRFLGRQFDDVASAARAQLSQERAEETSSVWDAVYPEGSAT